MAENFGHLSVHGPLRAIHTPGHTAGHVCFEVESLRIVLTGDHVLPGQFPGAGVGTRGTAHR